MQGEGRSLAVGVSYMTGDEKAELIGPRMGHKGIDLAAYDASNAGLLTDRRCIVDGNAHRSIRRLETAVGPQPIDGEVPEEHDANGEELGNVVANGEAHFRSIVRDQIRIPDVMQR